MAITYNYIERYGSNVSSTSHTFSAVPWANPAADRRIVVGVLSGSGNGATTGVTVGGVAATMISSGSRASGGGSHYSSFWIADLPTGSSGDVVIIHGSAKARIFCAVWEVFGINSNTPVDFQYSDATNTTSIDVPAGGLLLAFAGYNPSATWTGRGGDYLSVSAEELGRSITLNSAGGTNLTARPSIGPVSTTGNPNHIHAVTFAPGASDGITSITPNDGPAAGGTPVTIAGVGFTSATGVTFNGVAATDVVVVSDIEITCTTPAGTGLVDVVVLRPSTNLTLVDGFEFIPVVANHVTQLPILVINLPVQGTQVTQLPILVVKENKVAAMPLPLIPDFPFIETWQYYTVLSRAEGSREQRSSLRPSPRLLVSFETLILDDVDRRKVYQMLRAFIGRSFVYPVYPYSTKLTSGSLAGNFKLFFDPAQTDVRVGEAIAVLHPQTAVPTFYTVATVDVDGATVTTEFEDDIPATYYVCPAPLFRFRNQVGISMMSISGSYKIELESMDLRDVLRPDQSTTLTTYDGHNVLDKVQLANDEVDENFEDDVDWLDNGISRAEPVNLWPIPFISGKRDFLVHRHSGEVDYWRAFAAATIGRQKTFLMPTFRDDISLVSQPALGATSLFSPLVQLTNYWTSPAYKYIRIASDAGVIYRKMNEVVPVHDPVTGEMTSVEIKLNSSIGAAAGSNENMKVSYAYLCRLDNDEVRFTHETFDSIMSLSIRMVEA